MSAGPFLNAFYEADSGAIAPISIQPETAALVITGVGTNTIPAGPANLPVPAKVSSGRRSRNLNARLVRVKVTSAGTSDLTVGSTIALPWLQFASFQDIVRGQVGTYRNGSAIEVVGKSPQTGI